MLLAMRGVTLRIKLSHAIGRWNGIWYIGSRREGRVNHGACTVHDFFASRETD